MDYNPQSFWSISSEELLEKFLVTPTGLTNDEVKERLSGYGPNRLKPQKRSDTFSLFIGQFKSPIIIILLFATVLSLFLHNLADASIILTIVDSCNNVNSSLHTYRKSFWIHTPEPFYMFTFIDDCGCVCYRRGNCQNNFLQKG